MNFINAGDPDKAVTLGNRYLLRCQVSPAEKAFTFALNKKEAPEAYHGMSKIAEFKRDNEKALQYGRKAYNLNPLPKYYLQIKRMLFIEGYIDSANYYLEKYIEYGDSLNKDYPEILLKRGLGFFGKYTRNRTIAKIADNMIALGLLDSAEYYLDRVSGTGQDLAEINLVKAHYHFARGDTVSARNYLAEALRSEPKIRRIVMKDTLLTPIKGEFLNSSDYKRRRREKD